MTSRVEELQRMCDSINENGGLDSGEWHTALLAQIAQNLAVIADVMMADRKTEPTISKMEQVEDEPQTVRSNLEPFRVDEPRTEPLQTCSVNGRPYTDCCNCEYFKCTADEPQTDNGIGCSRCEGRFDCYDRDMPHAVRCNNYGKITDEPQTEREGE